jgi:hypothetical protein
MNVMKKKVLLATVALFVLIAGVVSAASIWGTYKGNDIIRLTVHGDPVKVSDVPVISYNNRTMIPIYLLKQAGINYTWDQKNKTVDITNSDFGYSVWAYCAAYFQYISNAIVDFTFATDQANTAALAINDGIASNDQQVKFVGIVLNKISIADHSYDIIFDTYSKQIHDYYLQMKMDTSDLFSIEIGYNTALKYLTSAYSNLDSYQKTKQQRYFDNFYSDLNNANDTIVKVRQTTNDEFDLFQNAIINSQ